MVQKYKEWTETYHSWKEYVTKNPNWDKHPSSRFAGEFIKMQIEEHGTYTAHCMTIPFDPVVHREVTNFLKKLHKANKNAGKGNLMFKNILESRVA